MEVHNWRRPLDRLTLTLTLTLTFDLIFIGGRGIVMDYSCAKLGDFSFSRFGFIARTDRQTESQRLINDQLIPFTCPIWIKDKLSRHTETVQNSILLFRYVSVLSVLTHRREQQLAKCRITNVYIFFIHFLKLFSYILLWLRVPLNELE